MHMVGMNPHDIVDENDENDDDNDNGDAKERNAMTEMKRLNIERLPHTHSPQHECNSSNDVAQVGGELECVKLIKCGVVYLCLFV